MSKKYQTSSLKDTAGPVVSVPAEVTVALERLSGQVQEGLLSLAVAAGLQVMAQLMEADVETAAGPKGRQNPDRTAVPARYRRGVGDVGRPAGSGRPAAGPGLRRLRRAAGPGV